MANAKSLYFWSDEETAFMLLQLKELDILKYIDGRKTRNGELFRKVAKKLEKAGFIRSPEQIRVRWKHLKQSYYRSKKMNGRSGFNPVITPHAEILTELLGHRALSIAAVNSVDSSSLSCSASASMQESMKPDGISEEPALIEVKCESVSEDSPPEKASTPPPRGYGPAAGRRKIRQTADMERFFERMRQMQNSWMSEQLQQSQEREERLVTTILESNNKVVSTIMETIHSLQPSTAATPQPCPPSYARTVSVNVHDKMGLTPLMVAAQKGFTSLVEILVKHGSDIDMRDRAGKDSLMLACYAGHLDTVTYLRQCGASWQSQDMDGCTPLHWAVDGGHQPVISYMIQDGCEVDVRDKVSLWTPLMHVSAISGDTAVASILLQAGADVNVRDKAGKTPLMVAVLNNHEELVKLLLDNGADHHIKNEYGAGAADMAKVFERENIMNLLE
ncbi:fibronectin type 3 and ankyrin repeat domains 1 protein-like isoform X1 [Myxocyprinus asiaticus]|uniref:fibronectin type 3 and ankyrin repeat domains 1 protein-like isoform X1 n=1 Tax=Myxocyprinus asiaticus TaxID=70543 RepID=UPI0022238970|nr:fibronectin type 3 and ankyrin repeat domains 1 protein-like isoform X1 [Myxocyprinus asiaticus]